MDKKKFFIIAVVCMVVSTVLGMVAAGRTYQTDAFEEETIKEHTKVVMIEEDCAPEPEDDATVCEDPTETAEDTAEEESAQENEEKDVDYYTIGDDGKVSGKNVQHNVFAANENLTLNIAGLDGILFGAGKTVNVNDRIDYGVVAGASVFVNGTIERDLFVAGQNISFDKDAEVRDVWAAGQAVTLRGDIYGNVNIAAEQVKFEDVRIFGDVSTAAAQLEFKDDVRIMGKLTYESETKLAGMKKENIGEIVSYKSLVKKDVLAEVLKAIAAVFTTIATMMLFVAFVKYVQPKMYDEAIHERNFWSNLGRGFLIMVVLPVAGAALIMTGYAAAIGLVLVMAFVIMMLLSSAPAAMKIGHFVMEKVFKQKKAGFYADALAGAVVWGVVLIIPVLGALALMFFEIEGFGMIALGVGDRIKSGHTKVHKV